MRCHRDIEVFYIIGEFLPDGSHVYMAWDGCGAYGDTDSGDAAEKFDTAKEAKHYLATNEDAKEWYEQHPKAKVLRMVYGYTVYPPR